LLISTQLIYHFHLTRETKPPPERRMFSVSLAYT